MISKSRHTAVLISDAMTRCINMYVDFLFYVLLLGECNFGNRCIYSHLSDADKEELHKRGKLLLHVYILSVYSPFSDRVGVPLHNIHIPSPFTSIMDIFFVDLKFGHIRFYNNNNCLKSNIQKVQWTIINDIHI